MNKKDFNKAHLLARQMCELRNRVIDSACNWAHQLDNHEYGSKPHKKLMDSVIAYERFRDKHFPQKENLK